MKFELWTREVETVIVCEPRFRWKFWQKQEPRRELRVHRGRMLGRYNSGQAAMRAAIARGMDEFEIVRQDGKPVEYGDLIDAKDESLAYTTA